MEGGSEQVAAKCSVPRAPGRHISEPRTHPGTFQIKQECLACRGAAAVFDMSYFGKFYLVGVDASKAADWLFSADVSRPPGTKPGQSCPCHASAPGRTPWARL